MILNKDIIPEEFQGCYEHHLNKWNQLAEDEPVVDHLGGRGGGQALHLADEDRGHHQHGGQVHAEGRLEEERLEEGGGKGDGDEEEKGKEGGHHLACDLSLQNHFHTQTVWIPSPIPVCDTKNGHVSILCHRQLVWKELD